jgi:pimeloyl-ACP methyl ester carboxylesterase
MKFASLKYPCNTKFINLSDNIRIAFCDEGSGTQTILFIHGLGSYIPTWKLNIPALKNYCRCIAVDLPGHGKSSKEIHSGSMSYYAKVLKEFLQELKIENAVLCGHSMGGQIAMNFTLQFPDLVDKLILAAPAGFEKFSKDEKEWIKSVFTSDYVMNTSEERQAHSFGSSFYEMSEAAEKIINDKIAVRDDPDYFKYCSIIANSLHGMLDDNIFENLNKIEPKTLIIFGKNDQLIPNQILHPNLSTAQIAQTGASQMPKSKLLFFPECGHYVQLEKPEMFNKSVIEFLQIEEN